MPTGLDLLKLEPGGVEFSRLVPDTSSRGAVIGSFVALLELCKRHVIFVKQDQIFQSIVVVLSSDNFDPQKFYSQGGLVSEFDKKEVFDTDSSGNEDAVANA